MTDMFCTYAGSRDEAIVAYLYDDISPTERAAFESHLASCTVCRAELASFRGVREELGEWSPPAFQSAPRSDLTPAARRSWWSEVPVWAQAVAAVLVLGVAAGAANLDVHHDATGFTVHTGWMRAPDAPPSADAAPWRADLAKLESEVNAVRDDSRAVSVALAAPASAHPAAGDEEVLRKVRAIVDESEKKEQNELALRVAQVVRERQAERVADLTKIERVLGAVQTNTGFAVQQQRDAINSLALRVSQTVR